VRFSRRDLLLSGVLIDGIRNRLRDGHCAVRTAASAGVMGIAEHAAVAAMA
jgi:hypothetical protein